MLTKKQKLIAGLVSGIAVVGFGANYYFTSTAKGIFLSRLNATHKLTKFSQNFSGTVTSSNSELSNLLDGFCLKGTSNLNNDHADVKLSLSSNFPMLNLDNLHLIVKGDEVYLNASTLVSYYANTLGFQITENLDQLYIDLKALAQEEQQLVPQTQDLFYNVKLQEEATAAATKYLAQLSASHFKKVGDEVTMTLNKTDLKEMYRFYLDFLIKSKNYDGDKEALKEAKENIDPLFDLYLKDSTLAIIVTQGKTAGNSKIAINYQAVEWGDVKINFASNVIDYQPPKEPTKIMTNDDLSKLFQEAAEKQYADLYQSSEIEE